MNAAFQLTCSSSHRFAWLLLIMMAISFPCSAFAREVKFEKKIDPGALQSQLVAAGYAVSWIECSVNRCKIVMPDSEKKDPMTIVKKYIYVDASEMRTKKLATLRALLDKWEAGTISNEEKDSLIKGTLSIVLGR